MFKCIVITKKKIFGLFLVLACFILGTTIMAAFAEERKIPIYCVDTDEKKISITFDCAWEDFDTDRILNVLKKYDARATFFVTGDYVRRCSASVKKFYEAGHDIGNHSDNELTRDMHISDRLLLHHHFSETDAFLLPTSCRTDCY